jgi:hypothetical protein
VSVSLSVNQLALLRWFLEYSDAAIPGKLQLNNFACEGVHVDFDYATKEIPSLSNDEWDQLIALFPPQ